LSIASPIVVCLSIAGQGRLLTRVVVIAVVCAGASCSVAPGSGPPAASVGEAPRGELRMASDEAAILQAARALMVADPVVALVTVDAPGQPRVRSVRALLEPVLPGDPRSGFTVWVMTRLTTRKVDQIRANPTVTLYFSDDGRDSYASLMGTALIHTDAEHPEAKRRYQGEDVQAYWPDFPHDFVMLEVRPHWLEFIGPGVSNDERTWRPQAVVFD
jgi:general stress protein 26